MEPLVTSLIVNIVVIIVAFIVLNWASNIAISNAIKVSTISRLGKTSVGFTMIALSTTLPEMTVALTASLSGGAPLSVGNVLGSNIFNISVIIGLAALLIYLKRPRKATDIKGSNGLNIVPSFAKSELRNIEFGLFISSLVPMILIYFEAATWLVGLILLAIFFGYMYNMSRVRVPSENEVAPEEKSKLKRYIAFTIVGAIGVVVSANFLVGSAIGIAESFKIPGSLIGATIVAFGTSLPELTVGLKSIMKGHSELAFGNIIGSSFINTTLILGITFFVPAVLGSAVTMNMDVFRNLIVFSIIINLLFWYFLSRGKIAFKEGAIFLFVYVFFILTTIGAV